MQRVACCVDLARRGRECVVFFLEACSASCSSLEVTFAFELWFPSRIDPCSCLELCRCSKSPLAGSRCIFSLLYVSPGRRSNAKGAQGSRNFIITFVAYVAEVLLVAVCGVLCQFPPDRRQSGKVLKVYFFSRERLLVLSNRIVEGSRGGQASTKKNRRAPSLPIASCLASGVG